MHLERAPLRAPLLYIFITTPFPRRFKSRYVNRSASRRAVPLRRFPVASAEESSKSADVSRGMLQLREVSTLINERKFGSGYFLISCRQQFHVHTNVLPARKKQSRNLYTLGIDSHFVVVDMFDEILAQLSVGCQTIILRVDRRLREGQFARGTIPIEADVSNPVDASLPAGIRHGLCSVCHYRAKAHRI